MTRSQFSKMITKSIEHLRISVARFGELVGVDEQTVYKWKSGEMGTTLKRLGEIQQRLIELRIPENIIFPDPRPIVRGIGDSAERADYSKAAEAPQYKQPPHDDPRIARHTERIRQLSPMDLDEFLIVANIVLDGFLRRSGPRRRPRRAKKAD